MPEWKKPRRSPGFGFVGVYRKCLVVPTAGVTDMICTAANRSAFRQVHDIEHQRRMDWNRRVQASRRLPGAVADAANEVAVSACRLQRQRSAVTCHREAFSDQTADSNLHPLDRRIDITRGAARAGLF